tara:strand:+ start:357 stop:926 length:570 start_codon:yes stop_codon:yes gene_type:complete
MIKQLKKLNLGCGYYPKEGFLNIDSNDKYPADLVHDLEIFPWPLRSNFYEEITMDHLLEHLTDIRKTMAEVNRILAINGKLVIKVPHFSRGFSHWDHKHGFDITFPLYFNENMSGGFNDLNLVHIKTRITWFAQPDFKKQNLSKTHYYLGVFGGKIFDFIGNINLFFTSKILCFWVGGYDEIEFVFRKS